MTERKTLGVLNWKFAVGAALLAGSALVVGSSAAFTDTATISANLSTGTIDITVDDQDGTVALNLDSALMKPGDSKATNFTLRNVGSINSVVSAATTTNNELSSQLNATVTSGGTTLYTGKLDALSFTGFAVNADQSRTLNISLALPASVGNDFQGKTESFSVTLTATQAP